MTIPEPDEKGNTVPIEPRSVTPTHVDPEAVVAPASSVEREADSQNDGTPTAAYTAAAVPQSDSVPQTTGTAIEPDGAVEPVVVARPASPQEREVLFVPLAVNIGDGFKFGCGFFLALVLAMLVGFVLVAALFVLTSLFGLNLPITR